MTGLRSRQPAYLIRRLQSVQNAAARLIFRLRRAITSLTLSPVFTGYECQKTSSSRSPCRLVERCMVTLGSGSTCNSSRASPTSLLGTDSGPQSPTVCSFLLSEFLLSVAGPFLSLLLIYGTIYRRTSPHHRRCSHLSRDRSPSHMVK